MKKSAGSEKRRHPRFPVGITMDIHAKGGTVGKCRGTISDLSTGGMSFKTTSELERGASLYLKINIPLEIRGEVRHIGSAAAGGMRRYGVRFHKFGFATADSAKAGDFIAARFLKS